jgi:DnaK suppressor protein
MEAHSRGHRVAGLTPAQLKKLRTKLVAARAEALDRLKENETTAREPEQEIEPMDAAEIAREQGDGALFVERARAQLREIDEALTRMEAGTYGYSERTGEPIGYDRLAIVPWARFAADEA